MDRREFFLGLTAFLGAPAWARAAARATGQAVTLAATWQSEDGHQVGLLCQSEAGLRVAAALDVPTRAHGLLLEPGGSLLAVARRPGDWLLRWDHAGRAMAWRWIEPRRAFSGHVLASRDGRTLYTTESDLDSGAGLIGVRDAASLEKRAEWPTHGIDSHELVWDARGEARLIVANGGVPTRPETGRMKRELARMDSSLVRLDAATGELLGQWRLADPRLSMRHLAWCGEGGRPVLGVALQAEHDEPATKDRAPVLALFDGRSLRTVSAPRPLAGYGGDIAALDEHFAVSCPRAGGVALHGPAGEWLGLIPLDEACALASGAGRLWAGGRQAALAWAAGGLPDPAAYPIPGIRLDNHWIALGT